jgi:uncharacterized protein YjbI with pentapeptide repeats
MKKFSNKYLSNYKLLSKARIGFELECYFETSFYKTLELLNKELSPVKVHGFRTYHSDFKPDANNFKLERDLSGGENMAEIVTGVLDYHTAKHYLLKLLKFINKYGFTNDKSSMHINISFEDKKINKINVLKCILNTNEDKIYKLFPERKNNVYAKSVKNIIPYQGYDYNNININTINNTLQIPKTKYYGLNFANIDKLGEERLEVRYIGGKNYEEQIGDILELMDEFIITIYKSIENYKFTEDEISYLATFLYKRINTYKNLSSYDNFLVEYPDIELQINQQNNYEVVSFNYGKIYKKLHNLLESVDNIEEAVINYHTETNKLELVGANFNSINDLTNIDFINCEIYGGIFSGCEFYDVKIIDSEIQRSKIGNSNVTNVKLISCNVQDSNLNNCYFQAGLLNSHMEGGIFRSGKIGSDATFSDSTKIVGKSEDNFFNTKYNSDEEDKSKNKFSK